MTQDEAAEGFFSSVCEAGQLFLVSASNEGAESVQPSSVRPEPPPSTQRSAVLREAEVM